MNKKIKNDDDYKRLGRLFNKRQHAIDAYEKKPTVRKLDTVLKFVGLLSSQIKRMGKQ